MPPDSSSSPDRQDVVTLSVCKNGHARSHQDNFSRPRGQVCMAEGCRAVVKRVEFVPLSRAEEEKEARERAERGEAGYRAAMNRVAAERDALLGSGATGPLVDALSRAEEAEAALVECARASGADLSDGPPTQPQLPEWAVEEVSQMRRDYDECPAPEDLARAEAEVKRLLRAYREDLAALVENLPTPKRAEATVQPELVEELIAARVFAAGRLRDIRALSPDREDGDG